jgi:hypothetical protein
MFAGHFLLGARNGYDEYAGYVEDKAHQNPGSRNEPMNHQTPPVLIISKISETVSPVIAQ